MMKPRKVFLLATCLAGLFTIAARADGIDEVGNFNFYWDVFDVAQGDRGEPLPGTVFPSLPPGFESPADVDFVADRANLTFVSGVSYAQPGAAFGVLQNGNFGIVASILIGNGRSDGSPAIDFSDAVLLLDILNQGCCSFSQMVPTLDAQGDFDVRDIITPQGDLTFGGLKLAVGFVVEADPFDDNFPDRPLRAYNLSALGMLQPGEALETVWAFDTGIAAPTEDCNGNWIADSGETDSDGDGVIDDCDLCPGDVPGELDVNGDGCTDTTTDVALAMEETVTPQFEETIDEILADPDVPDEIADDIQGALKDVIGNAGGNANNGAVDKLLETGDLVAAVVKTEAAIEDLQAAADQGFDTTDMQQLVTDFTRLGVLAAIVEAESVLGSGDPAVVAAQDLFATGDALLATGDFLGALALYKAAAQEIM